MWCVGKRTMAGHIKMWCVDKRTMAGHIKMWCVDKRTMAGHIKMWCVGRTGWWRFGNLESYSSSVHHVHPGQPVAVLVSVSILRTNRHLSAGAVLCAAFV